MKKLLVLLFFWPALTLAQTNTARMLSGVNYIPQAQCPYTVSASDVTKLDVFTSTIGCTVTLPAANTAGFGVGTIFSVMNQGAGSVSISPASGTINGVGTLILSTGQGADIYSDGVNYAVQQGAGTGSGGGVGSCTQFFLTYWATTTGLGCTGSAISGAILQNVNSSAPVFTVEGLPLGNSGSTVTSCPYTIKADTSTTTQDRGTAVAFNSSSACSVTINDPSGSGMGGSFPVRLENIGTGTVTVNRQTSATFYVLNGSTASTGLTSFTIPTGQFATLHSDNTNWWVDFIGGSGAVSSGTQCETVVYPSSGTTVGTSTIACDATKFSGVDPTGATDSAAGLNTAIAAAISAKAELYVPAGTYKVSASLTAASNTFRMRCGGTDTTSITASASGYNTLIIGPGATGTYVGPNGYIKDCSLAGNSRTSNSGISALQLSGTVQFTVENVTVDTDDLGIDAINDAYGTVLRNVRGGFAGDLNVGINLRTGTSSGSDWTIVDPWMVGVVCGISVSGGGGYHVIGGQLGVGFGTGSPTDTSGAICLGKDYLTSATAETSMDIHGTSFEGTDYGWMIRGFYQTDLKMYGVYANPSNSSAPAIGFYKNTDSLNGRVFASGTNISGYWSNAVLVTVSGANPGVYWEEENTYTAASFPTINGVSTYVHSIAAQSNLPTSNYVLLGDNLGNVNFINSASNSTIAASINNVYYADGFTSLNYPGIGVAQTAWSSGTYPLCTAVSYSGADYLAVGTTTGVTPGTNSAVWYAVQNANTPTQLDCAFYYALAAGIAAGQGNVIKLGTNNYVTNIGIVEPTGQVHTDLVGVDKGVNGYPTEVTAGTTLAPSNYIVYSPSQGGSLPYNFLLENISFNGGGLVTGGCAEIQGQKAGVIAHLYCSNWNYTSGSAIPFWFGSAGSYQMVFEDIFVASIGNSQGATITASGTGSSLTYSIGGFSYQNPPITAFLYGFSNGQNPCATMGTLSTTYTGSSAPYTLTAINMSGFSGCTGPYYVHVPDLPANQTAIEFDDVTDSTASDIIDSADGWKYGIFWNGSGSNVAFHEHVYSGSNIEILDAGESSHYGVELDTTQHIGIWSGTQTKWTDTIIATPGAAAPVTGMVAFGFNGNAGMVTNSTCPNSSTSANVFNLVENSSGPIAHGGNYGGINVVNGEQCDTLTYDNSFVAPLTVPATVTYAGTTAGSVNVMTLASASISSLHTGTRFQFLPNLANTTTTPTLNVNSLGAVTVTKLGRTALAAGDLTTTAVADVIYDGTDFELQNPQTAPTAGISNTTITVGTTTINANTCTSNSTATMTGVASTSTFIFTPNASVTSVTGWGSTGGLVINAYPTTNTLNYSVCNQTSANITPSASVTFNVAAK